MAPGLIRSGHRDHSESGQLVSTSALMLIVIWPVLFWRVRPLAGVLLVPYILWVGFATVLTITLVRLNG